MGQTDWFKYLFITTAFFEAAIMGSIPILSKKFSESPCVLGVANAFSGGVFIAICLIHIMPEQSETWYCRQYNFEACLNQIPSQFPLPFFLLVAGYTVILIIDKVLFDTHAILGDDHDHKDVKILPATGRRSSILSENVASLVNGDIDQIQAERAIKSNIASSFKKTEKFAAQIASSRRESMASRSESLVNAAIDENAKVGKPGCVENMTPFVLLVGLGTHAIFEGLALGLASKWKSVIPFAVAIWLHKGAAGMSLGISMNKTFPDEKNFCLKMILLFAVFTPVGVSLGMALESSGNELIELTFACLAAGSFLYIACSEVIIEEFSVSSFRFTKLAFFIVGIMMILCLHFLPDADEGPCVCGDN